jgi:succinylarginine dihydrolase
MAVTISGSGQIVKQVVNATISTAQTTSSASAQNSGLTATITPTSSSSKILVTVTSVCGQNYSGRSEFLYLYKNGSQVFRYELFLNTVSAIPITFTYLDSPATTSATTYALWFSADGLGPAGVSLGNTVSTINLQEISGA